MILEFRALVAELTGPSFLDDLKDLLTQLDAAADEHLDPSERKSAALKADELLDGIAADLAAQFEARELVMAA